VPIQFHPPQGCIVRVDFDACFRVPEMVKPRLCVVLSKPMKHRKGLCTVVPLSTTDPVPVAPYHCRIDIPFPLPQGWQTEGVWVKGDMLYAAGYHRIELLRLGKDRHGRRIHQLQPLPEPTLQAVQSAVLHGLSLGALTTHLRPSICDV
jgi:uncharacterized protein YifN (PemK superfamily)